MTSKYFYADLVISRFLEMWPSEVALAFHLSSTCTMIWCHLVFFFFFSFGKRKKFLKMCVFLGFVNTKVTASLEESKVKIMVNVISYYPWFW